MIGERNVRKLEVLEKNPNRHKRAWFSAEAKERNDGEWQVSIVADFVPSVYQILPTDPTQFMLDQMNQWLADMRAGNLGKIG